MFGNTVLMIGVLKGIENWIHISRNIGIHILIEIRIALLGKSCLHSKIAILHSVIVHRNCFGHVVIFCEE